MTNRKATDARARVLRVSCIYVYLCEKINKQNHGRFMKERCGIISDVHAPFHGDEYYLAIDVLSERVDHLIINGDFLDMYGCNFYGKHPSVATHVENEIDWCVEEFERLVKIFPKITFLLGNHEYRFERQIISNTPQFYNLCNLQTCLHLKRLKIDWLPYQHEFKITENLRLQHSPPSYSVNLAMTSAKKKPGASYIYGCSHRIDFAVINLSNGGQCEVYSPGWLGSTDKTSEHRKVFAYTKNHKQWQHGFAIVDIDYRGRHHVEMCHIKDGIVKADGHIWQI